MTPCEPPGICVSEHAADSVLSCSMTFPRRWLGSSAPSPSLVKGPHKQACRRSPTDPGLGPGEEPGRANFKKGDLNLPHEYPVFTPDKPLPRCIGERSLSLLIGLQPRFVRLVVGERGTVIDPVPGSKAAFMWREVSNEIDAEPGDDLIPHFSLGNELGSLERVDVVSDDAGDHEKSSSSLRSLVRKWARWFGAYRTVSVVRANSYSQA